MTEFLTLNFAFVLCAVLLVCVIYVLIYAVKVNTRLSQSLKLVNDLYQLSQQQAAQLNELVNNSASNANGLGAEQDSINQSNQAEIANLHSKSDACANKLSKLEESIVNLSYLTEQLQHSDPETKMYTKAKQLVDAGASTQDIVEACGLPPAEVEMLMGLKRKK